MTTEITAKGTSYILYIDTPAAYGGISLGKLMKWDHLEMVRFFYTRIDGTPFVLDFKSEDGFYRWLDIYAIKMGTIFDNTTMRLKLLKTV